MNIQEQALKEFNSVGYPTVKSESWRFTDISRLKNYTFDGLWKESNISYEPFDNIYMIFENGKLSLEKSNLDSLPDGLTLKSINDFKELKLDSLKSEKNGIINLNTANFNDGYYLKVEDDISINCPIHIIYLTDSDNFSNCLRNFVEVGNNSKVTIIEEYLGNDDIIYLTNSITEVYGGDNSNIDHYKYQHESNQSFHFQTIEVTIGSNSIFYNHSISLGCELGRNDIRGILQGDNSEIICNGLYLLKDSQLFDTHLFMDHAVPNCKSHELYKGILADKSKGVFCGRILVQPDAQQTDAIQSNANLLLSRAAKVNTMPQLEIYADDVKCTHGATIGEIDEKALFYMKSRGLDELTANSLLTFAFANEVVDEISFKPMKIKIERAIESWLKKVL